MLNNRTTFMERLNDRVTAIETLLQKLEPIEGLLEIGLLGDVKTFYPKSNLISKYVLAKKSLIHDSN